MALLIAKSNNCTTTSPSQKMKSRISAIRYVINTVDARIGQYDKCVKDVLLITDTCAVPVLLIGDYLSIYWKSLGNAGGRSKSHVFCPLFKGSPGTITDHKRISRDLASTVNFKRKCRRFSYDLFGTSHQFFQKCTKKSVFRVFLNRTRHTQYIALYWIR